MSAPVANAEHTRDAEALLAQDAANRSRAIDTDGSFIVEAPAGAGKTELLTQRFLALLARVNDPEEIIALTFTNKAAAEMRQRVVESLHLAAGGTPPEQPHKQLTFQLGRKVLARDAQRQWDLLGQSSRLQITTLDALCGRLARQMPLLSRFGSQPAIAQDAAPLYQRAAQETLQMLEGGDAVAESLAQVLARFDNDVPKVQRLLQEMLQSRDQWTRHSRRGLDLDGAEAALAALVQGEMQTLCAVLPPATQRQLMPAACFAASQILLMQAAGKPQKGLERLGLLDGWNTPLQPGVEDLPRWQALCDLLLTGDDAVRKQAPTGIGFSQEGRELGVALKAVLLELDEQGAADVLGRLRKLPSTHYGEEEREFIGHLMQVLMVATAQLWLAFKAQGEVDFAQMSNNALLALGDDGTPTDLQLQLDYRISHLLVDEFQDTSPTQIELLERLTAGWQPGDGRTLFLVGDPMQSIYKFRKADVGLFIKVRERGLGELHPTPLRLYRNNRSNAPVVEWVNQHFPAVFADHDDYHRGAVKFEPATPTRGDHPLAGVQVHALIDGAAPAEPDDEDEETLSDDSPADTREAEAIVQIIRRAQADDPSGSIAVLVRARSHLDALVAQLRAATPALPFQAVEIEPLGGRQVIQDLLSLALAMCHLGDRTQWLAVLRAPWCGLTLADLHALAGDDHRTPIWSLMQQEDRVQRLSVDGRARLMHVRAVLAEALQHQGRQTPRRWIEGAWQCLGGPLCLQSDAEALDAQAFFETADSVEDGGSLDLTRLQYEVGKLYAAPDPAAASDVQLMTIHKSKGLEFDTVILPGLHRHNPRTDRPLLLWDEVMDEQGREQLVMAPLPAGAQASQAGVTKYAYLQDFERERGRNELQRLLYVAATRAKRQLHLLGVATPSRKDPQVLAEPRKGSLLQLLWSSLHEVFDAEWRAKGARPDADNAERPHGAAFNPDAAPDPALFAHRLVRLRAPAVPAALRDAPPAQDATTTAADAGDAATADDDSSWADASDRLAADVGTLVHRYLELIARDGLTQWPVDRVQSLLPAMRRWLLGQGHAPVVAQDAALEVQQHLSTCLQSDDARWVLQAHAEAASELPLSSGHAEQVQSHIIDRTFLADGVRWIIDYKTTHAALQDAAPDDPRVAAFRGQLERYAALFVDAPQVRVAVLLTWTGKLLYL